MHASRPGRETWALQVMSGVLLSVSDLVRQYRHRRPRFAPRSGLRLGRARRLRLRRTQTIALHRCGAQCGNGGDAIWLAENQWTVTAVDISTAATDRLTQLAGETGLKDRVTATPWDLNRGLPEGEFDLTNAHYLHARSHLDRISVFRPAAGALRPSGHLLIVDHGSTAPWSWNQDANQHYPGRRRYTPISHWTHPDGRC